MNVQDAKQEIINALRAYYRRDEAGRVLCPAVRRRPILLMGPPGIGKTAILEQAAAEAGVGLVSYTMTHHTRQSAIGLPHIEQRAYGGRTVSVTEYTLSEVIASVYDCMERTGKREGILFIDEINCVSETLAPTMLQFLQNKTFGNHRVPEGWLIVAAGNPPGYNRSVREFDVVTLDRVRQIDIQPDLEAWLDYALARQVHGAILAYLRIRGEDFYRVERRDGALSFVTARGWEDLSELIRGYEDLALPVTEDQVRQYLRNDDVARGFAGYYKLYRKYGQAYAVPEILDGTAGDLAGQTAMARAGSFEERLAVVNQLLDCLGGQFARYAWADQTAAALHQALGSFRLFLKDRGDIACLDEFVRGRRDALAVKRETGLVSPEDQRLEEWVLARLEAYGLELKSVRILDKAEGFQRLKDLFQGEVSARAALAEDTGAKLDRAFAFLEESFGEGQELLLFVSALTRMDQAMDFISRHGCAPYLEHSRLLLYQERETSLREACAQALEETSPPN